VQTRPYFAKRNAGISKGGVILFQLDESLAKAAGIWKTIKGLVDISFLLSCETRVFS